MNLTKNFTLEELTDSHIAKRYGIKNAPSETGKAKLAILAKEILQPIRDAYGKAIIVTSGYRSGKVNEIAGGVKNSDHVYCCAADIRSVSDTVEDNKRLWETVVRLWKEGKIPTLKQCINEYNYDWIHVSFQDGRTAKRGQFLDARRVKGKTIYNNSKI